MKIGRREREAAARTLAWASGALVMLCTLSFAQAPPSGILHGVTVDNKHDIRNDKFRKKLLDSLNHLSVKPTVRIVYTPGDKHGYFSGESYLTATKDIRNSAFVLAQPVDSYYMRCFTPAEHLARFKDYVDALGPYVDIWEVGNEINGQWLFGPTEHCKPGASVSSTSQADVVTKMVEAYDYLRSQVKATALTLYYNAPCNAPSANEMFTWTDANVPARMKAGLDYLLVSYYELDCHGARPDWKEVFGRLATMFPNSKLGFSEFGWSGSRPSEEILKDLITRFYAVHPDVPGWISGGFYWEFAIDMVPYDPKPMSLWTTVNQALANQK